MLVTMLSLAAAAATPPAATCSILAYHRFGPDADSSMSTTTAVFARQMAALRAAGYHIVPLADLVDTLRRRQSPGRRLVALTIDDGHHTVYTELLPVLRAMALPATLFIYPSAISHARYALTWEQLRSLATSPAIEIGAHTYWHPDFRQERLRLPPADYARFAANQLSRPRIVLRKELGVEARFLAWPYGIHDDQLARLAQDSGYAAAFALGNRNATAADPLYALPRHMVVDAVGIQGLLKRLAGGPACMP